MERFNRAVLSFSHNQTPRQALSRPGMFRRVAADHLLVYSLTALKESSPPCCPILKQCVMPGNDNMTQICVGTGIRTRSLSAPIPPRYPLRHSVIPYGMVWYGFFFHHWTLLVLSRVISLYIRSSELLFSWAGSSCCANTTLPSSDAIMFTGRFLITELD